MEFKDYYKILGVEPDADQKAVKSAYRRLARKYHPDVSSEQGAADKFKEVSEAYEVLSDETKRAEYDQLRQYGQRGSSFEPPPGWQSRAGGTGGSGGMGGMDGDFSEFFSSIFGGGFGGRSAGFGAGARDFHSARGQDMEVEMPVFLEETIEDRQKTVEFNQPVMDEHGHATQKRKKLKVTIPAGVMDGERIRLKGQGGPGVGQGQPGDLYLRIRLVPHPLFDVVGRDLNITVPVAPWEAALGTRVTVPTLEGKIQLTIKPGSQTGQRLRIKGKGLKRRGQQGDLYAIIKVVMPEEINEESRTLWQKLADSQAFDPRSEWEKAS